MKKMHNIGGTLARENRDHSVVLLAKPSAPRFPMPLRTQPASTRFKDTPAITHLIQATRAVGDDTPALCLPVFTQFILNKIKRPYVFGRHRHWEFEIILVVRGKYRCLLNDREVCLSDDGVLLVQPGDWHEDFCNPPLEYAGLRFSFPDSAARAEDVRFFRSDIPPEQQHTRMASEMYLPLLEKIAREASQGDMSSSHLQDALMSELFWRLVRAFSPTVLARWLAPVPSESRFLERLRQCFAQNMHSSPSVPKIAKMLGISQRALSQRCASLLNTSPAKALLRLRVQYASQLLTQTEMSVKEVGYRLGFSNPYHFSRVYKQVMGHPPSADKTPTPP